MAKAVSGRPGRLWDTLATVMAMLVVKTIDNVENTGGKC